MRLLQLEALCLPLNSTGTCKMIRETFFFVKYMKQLTLLENYNKAVFNLHVTKKLAVCQSRNRNPVIFHSLSDSSWIRRNWDQYINNNKPGSVDVWTAVKTPWQLQVVVERSWMSFQSQTSISERKASRWDSLNVSLSLRAISAVVFPSASLQTSAVRIPRFHQPPSYPLTTGQVCVCLSVCV